MPLPLSTYVRILTGPLPPPLSVKVIIEYPLRDSTEDTFLDFKIYFFSLIIWVTM